MKLHLPKVLFAAVVMACSVAQAATTNAYSITLNGTTYGNNGNAVEVLTGGTGPATEADYIVIAGGRTQITSDVFTNADTTVVIAGGSYKTSNDAEAVSFNGGQLFLNQATPIDNNFIIGSSSGYSENNWNGAMRLHDAEITLNGSITLVQDATLLANKNVYLNGALSGNHTLTLTRKGSATDYFYLSGGGTLGGLAGDANVAFSQYKSNDGSTAAFGTSYTIGNLATTGTVTIDSGVSLTIGSTINSGTLNILKKEITVGEGEAASTETVTGKLVVESWAGFNGSIDLTGVEEIAANGLTTRTGSFTVLGSNASLAEGSYDKYWYKGNEYSIKAGYNGVVNIYVVAQGDVVVGATGTTDADFYALNGGTLKLEEGTLSSSAVKYFSGSVNLAEGTSCTGLDSVADATLISSITGSGTLYIAETYTTDSSYNGTITTSEGFSGKVYVTSGNFTLNGTTHGETIQLANGVNMQITSNFEFEKSMILDSGNHQIHTNGNILTISGNISGAGTLEKVASGSITIADGASIENYKHSTNTTNVTGGAVKNLTIAGDTVNVSGGSVSALTITGGTINVTGGSITTVKMKGSGNQNFKLADGATSASYTLGSISTVDANSYGCNITIDSGVTVEAKSVTPGWGFGTITVNGSLKLTEMLELATGNNNDTTRNVITGSGIIDTKKLSIGNIGTYNISGVTMKIGEGGIKKNGNYDAGYTKTNLGAMTIEAKANWDSDVNTLKLVATGSDSTVINTAGYTVALKAGLGGTGNLTKTGEGTLKIGENNATFTSGAVTVSGGKLELNKADGNYTISSLTLNGGALDVTGSVTLNALTVDFSKYSTDTLTHTLVTSGGLSLGEGVDLSKLTFSEGDYTGSVAKVGESLVLSYVLAGDTDPITTTLPTKVTDVLGYENGMLTLQVEGLLTENTMAVVDILGDPSTDALMAEVLRLVGETKMVAITLEGTLGGELVADAFDKVVFVNEKGEGYYGEMVGGQLMYNVDRIPEPTTATLSLLALMGLAARRRRQK